MVVKPAIGFLSSDNDAQLITDTETIIVAMTNNPAYPSPAPTLAIVTAAKNDFATAVANAANGGTTLTLIKNEKRAALVALMRELDIYVHMACKGNLADLQTSGFPTWKPTRMPVGQLPAPAAPLLSLGVRSGQLAASTPPVPNGYTYNWRVSTGTPPVITVRVQTTAASNLFENLTPGQIYLVDVNVVGSAGPSDFSDTTQLMVV